MIFRSVCSGIEAASVAWEPLGWRADAFAEIDKFPSAVLAHRYPGTPNLGDMTKFKEWDDANFDVLVGGTPCQSFSVAGLRKGLDDPRGNLMLVYAAIARRYRPRWMVWENVPGVLSDDGGRSFATLLGLLSGQVVEAPKGGWQSAGAVPGYKSAYGLAWRVLDAQYIRVDGFARAVPQRRKRVFVIGYLGDWRRAAAVLFERDGLQGNSAPRRQAGQRTAPTLSARTKGGGGLGTDFDCDGGLVAAEGEVAKSVKARSCSAHREDADTYVPIAFGGNNTEGPIDVATACRAKGGTGHGDFESETFVAHALKADGFYASEDGTGRGTPLVPVAFMSNESFSSGDNIDVSPTLRIGSNGQGQPPAVAFDMRGLEGGAQFEGPHDTANIRAASGGSSRSYVAQPWRVRRLTPLECTRLQGFPDDYFSGVLYRGKPPADGPIYKALGNSFAVNVVRWIGRRIQMVEDIGG